MSGALTFVLLAPPVQAVPASAPSMIAVATKVSSAATGQSTTYKEARSKLKRLPVKGRAANTGYSRAKFGAAWLDRDKNGCDTRNDILRRDLKSKRYAANTRHCVVTRGVLADMYTGKTISFNKSKNASAIQIDHVVALNDAWRKGAQKLSKSKRADFANDPLNLLAVDGPANMQKGAGDAATWLPKKKSFRCRYVATQVDVKKKYKLWVTRAERDAMSRILKNCTGNIKQLEKVAPLKAPPKKKPTSSSRSYAPVSKTSCPSSAPIKGNRGSNGWIYHVRGGSYYNVTHPEECFKTEAHAKAAGYRKSLR